MLFGLKNASLVYQAVIKQLLAGFVRLLSEGEALVDRDVLKFLKLNTPKAERVCDQDPERI